MTQCPHCGVPHEKHEWMFHLKDCPHGKCAPERLLEIPDWKLEQELIRRHATPTIHELLAGGQDEAVKQAAMLSECLVWMRKLSRLTRWKPDARVTFMHVPNGLICELDRLLGRRGVPPPEDDHTD